MTKQQLREFLGKYGYYFLPVLAIVIIVFLSLLMAPKFLEMIKVRTGIKEEEGKVTLLTEKLQSLKQMNSGLLREQVDKTTEIVPDQKKIAEIFLNLKMLADEEGIFMDEIAVNPGEIATSSGKMDEMEFKTVVSGAWENLMKFFRHLNLLAPALNLREIEMKHSESDVWRIELSFFGFHSDKKLTFTPDSPLPQLSVKGREIKGKLTEFEALYLKEIEGVGVLEELPSARERDIFSLP